MKHKVFLSISIFLILLPASCAIFLIPISVYDLLPSIITAPIGMLAVINLFMFNTLPACHLCGLLNGASHNAFIYCGVGVVYLRASTVILVYVLPAIYFYIKYRQTKPFVSKWRKYQ